MVAVNYVHRPQFVPTLVESDTGEASHKFFNNGIGEGNL